MTNNVIISNNVTMTIFKWWLLKKFSWTLWRVQNLDGFLFPVRRLKQTHPAGHKSSSSDGRILASPAAMCDITASSSSPSSSSSSSLRYRHTLTNQLHVCQLRRELNTRLVFNSQSHKPPQHTHTNRHTETHTHTHTNTHTHTDRHTHTHTHTH